MLANTQCTTEGRGQTILHRRTNRRHRGRRLDKKTGTPGGVTRDQLESFGFRPMFNQICDTRQIEQLVLHREREFDLWMVLIINHLQMVVRKRVDVFDCWIDF